MASPRTEEIARAPGPWTLKGTIYMFMMYISSKDAQVLSEMKPFLYSPLEAGSSYSEGKLIGGMAMVQVIRYTESPVGPYDELVMVPGNYEYQRDKKDKDGNTKVETKKNLRISRIYVSTKESCWNGRQSWNIPKHLARFEFIDLPDKSVSVAVYPYDTGATTDESKPSSRAFFRAIYKPIPYLPNFPASTGLAKHIGMDLTIAQPPLPLGANNKPLLPGTDRWCALLPLEYSSKTSFGWWNLKPGRPTEEDPLLAGAESGFDEDGSHGNEGKQEWWPGLGKWRIGLRMEEATVEFPEGEHWYGPQL